MNMLKKICSTLVCLLLVSMAFSQADKAKYYIEGEYRVDVKDGKFVYKLYDITSNKIYFTAADTIIGEDTPEGFQSFVFRKARTDYQGGFEEGMKFWRWQKDAKKWQIDSEVKNATASYAMNKVMTVMLILDCSKSIGDDDFTKLKRSAVQFIETIYSRSSNGNVSIGIVGFNSMKNTDAMVYPISPLDSMGRKSMEQFIYQLELGPNTALYYAMNKGVQMIQNYVNSIRWNENMEYDGAYLVSFTDGYDNASVDPQIGVPDDGLDNPYFKYVKDNLLTHNIADKPVDSYIIAVKGNDVDNNQKFEAVLKGISSAPLNDHFYLVDNFSALNNQFENIAKSLINRWQDLNCFVPPSFKGKVRWTLGNEQEYVQEKTPAKAEKDTIKASSQPKGKASLLMGMNIGFGGMFGAKTDSAAETYPKKSSGFDISVGFDIAAKVKDNFAIGGFVAYEGAIAKPKHMHSFSIGPLCQIGSESNAVSGIAAVGVNIKGRSSNTYTSSVAFIMRGGVKFNKPSVYVFAEVGFGGHAIITANVGYEFGHLIKKNK